VNNGPRVKCRYCSWSRPVWWTARDGKKRNGFDALREHMSDAHKDEFFDLLKKCNESTADALKDAEQIARAL